MHFPGMMKKVSQLLLCFSLITYLLPAAHPHVVAITAILPAMERPSYSSTSTPLIVAFPFFLKFIISFPDILERICSLADGLCPSKTAGMQTTMSPHFCNAKPANYIERQSDDRGVD